MQRARVCEREEERRRRSSARQSRVDRDQEQDHRIRIAGSGSGQDERPNEAGGMGRAIASQRCGAEGMPWEGRSWCFAIVFIH
mmetsp:Transcript_48162/g.113667  ORF Transcript_48162/g.113667 Transcript_48162/m.113667 type:complete len:83 (-) Transcript_48162:14-262(-)|eukprot:1711642-Rhodomonas_salina.1